jgi:hypothetical protein
MRNPMHALLFGVSFLSVHSAMAASCVPMMTDLVNYSRGPGQYLIVTVASNQQNSIVSWSGHPSSAALDDDGAGGLKTQAAYHHMVLYSDRQVILNTRPQPFDSNKPDFIDIQVAPDGSKVWIKSITWGFTNPVTIQSCDNGVMYGWGSAIGNHNNRLPALYTFSFSKRKSELAP